MLVHVLIAKYQNIVVPNQEIGTGFGHFGGQKEISPGKISYRTESCVIILCQPGFSGNFAASELFGAMPTLAGT
jgi:hypothetical protein